MNKIYYLLMFINVILLFVEIYVFIEEGIIIYLNLVVRIEMI